MSEPMEVLTKIIENDRQLKILTPIMIAFWSLLLTFIILSLIYLENNKIELEKIKIQNNIKAVKI
jgi:hypothetical protein